MAFIEPLQEYNRMEAIPDETPPPPFFFRNNAFSIEESEFCVLSLSLCYYVRYISMDLYNLLRLFDENNKREGLFIPDPADSQFFINNFTDQGNQHFFTGFFEIPFPEHVKIFFFLKMSEVGAVLVFPDIG